VDVTITPQPEGYLLEAGVRIPRPLDEVFAFFADAGNLEDLTPDGLRFRILTPAPIEMRRGTLIDYRLRVRGVPVRWQSEITAWEPPVRFVDEQRRGPYRWWRHEHRFREEGDETVVEDRVAYAVPGGALVHALFVGREVRKIFRFRHRRLLEEFTSGG
jgi:ligand-binding SRPBCC domain-containing protein